MPAHGRVALALFVLACILLPLTGVAVWGRNQLLNTDRYVSTVKPLATDPVMVEYEVTTITNAAFEAIDLDTKVQDLLPDKAGFLAPAIEGGLRRVVEEQVRKIVTSDAYVALWETANRVAHSKVVAILTGTGRLSDIAPNGTVEVDLTPVLGPVREALSKIGIFVFSPPARDVAVKLSLFDASQISSIRSMVRLLDKLANVLPWVIVALFAASVALASDRRRATVRAGLGIIGACFFLALVVGIGRRVYLGAVSTDTFPRPVARTAFDIVSSGLRYGLRTVFVVGVVVTAVAALFGPSRGATYLRSRFDQLVARRTASSTTPGPVAVWFGANRNAAIGAVVALGGLRVLFTDHPSGGMLLWTTVFVLVGAAAVVLVGAPGAASTSEEPAAADA